LLRRTGEAVMYEGPVLVFDERSGQPGRITSRWMRYDMDGDSGTAVGEVRMAKGETRATCDSAVIFNDLQYVELFGSPSARSGGAGMSGERAVLHYRGEGIERIVLPTGGRLTEAPPAGSPWRSDSWIEGDSVVIHMSDDDVDSVRIFGGARAMYYPYEGELNKVSNNFSKGDTMFFRFDGDELRYVRISGSASGTYHYLNLGAAETIDSIAAGIDSSLVFRDFAGTSETVAYEAKLIEYFAATEDIVLKDGAKVDYQNKSLAADFINFSSRLNVLDAHGDPVLEEAGQKMYGYGMGYDMDSAGGIVMDGSTRYDQGYYLGKRIFKQGDDVLKVYGSVYTTCDYRRAHYSMRAGRMKVYIDDKIVSGPITLYIGEIPCFYLPYIVNSIRRDRHSGLLRPNFDIGLNSRDGRFIRGLGYYWATSDYTDFILSTDFNENRNFRVHLTNRYKVRYLLEGTATGDFFRNFDANSYEWTFKSNHSQRFGKTASLRADLSFVSSDEAPSQVHRADDIDRIVDRRIYSTVSFNKSWGGTRLGLSASRNQKLGVSADNPTENSVTTTMPSLSLNLPRTSLWPGEKHAAGRRSVWERVLREVTLSPNLRATRTTEVSEARRRQRLTASSGASLSRQNKVLFLNLSPSIGINWNYSDVLSDFVNPAYVTAAAPAVLRGEVIPSPSAADPIVIGAGENIVRIAVNGVETGDAVLAPGEYASGSSLALEIESAINADPGLGTNRVSAAFVDESDGTGRFVLTSNVTGPGSSIEVLDAAGSAYDALGLIAGSLARGASRQGLVPDTTYRNELSMSLSLGVGTTLYGTFYPKIGPLLGLRHTFNPSISYSYTPALTRSQTARQGMTWSLRNVLDLKYLQGGQERKANNIFTWNMSGSFDPEAEQKRFSQIRSSIRTSLGPLDNISLNHTYDPYEREILSTSLSAGISLGGDFSYPAVWRIPEPEKLAAAKDLAAGQGEPEPPAPGTDEYDGFDPAGDRPGSGPAGGPGSGNRWTLGIGYSYSAFGGAAASRPSSKVDMRATLFFTKRWRLGWSAYYDVEGREFTTQQYSLDCDLHCWEAGFVHRRFGDEMSYYFQIRIKAHRDIQYEQGKRGLGSSVPGFL
ncbi:MAG: putative LPS assembly protein LptD, partial [Candidatus Krumholzibacteria bacterium]|nr:putative LPS assembly protein LptD [Candidatus Krumholzibacteria bacterium]